MIKNKFLKIFLGELLILLVLVAGMTIVKMIPVEKTVENNLEATTYFPKIYEKEFFISPFTATANNLKRIDVLFKNPNLESRDQIDIYVLEGKKVIFHQEYNGYNFGDTSHARIDFPTISDSMGKSYKVVVRMIKVADAKLQIGVKNNEIDFIQYYGQNMGIKEALVDSISTVKNIFWSQTVVLGLPMLLWGAFLW